MSYFRNARLQAKFENSYDRGLLIWGEGPDEKLYETLHLPVGILKWIYQLSAGYIVFSIYSYLKEKKYNIFYRLFISISAYTGMMCVWNLIPAIRRYDDLSSKLAHKYSLMF